MTLLRNHLQQSSGNRTGLTIDFRKALFYLRYLANKGEFFCLSSKRLFWWHHFSQICNEYVLLKGLASVEKL